MWKEGETEEVLWVSGQPGGERENPEEQALQGCNSSSEDVCSWRWPWDAPWDRPTGRGVGWRLETLDWEVRAEDSHRHSRSLSPGGTLPTPSHAVSYMP